MAHTKSTGQPSMFAKNCANGLLIAARQRRQEAIREAKRVNPNAGWRLTLGEKVAAAQAKHNGVALRDFLAAKRAAARLHARGR